MILSGCTSSEKNKNNTSEINKNLEVENAANGVCEKEDVVIEGYGEPGKKLSNCFVEYPGEPSRQDKSYYIVEDICGQFTKEFVESALGQKIVKVEPPKIAGLNNCSYYLNDKEYLLINLEYLPIANQKTFYEQTGDKIEKDSKILADNLVVTQGNIVSRIFFVLGPQKFISLSPLSKNTIENEKLVNFAINIGAAIKNYK